MFNVIRKWKETMRRIEALEKNELVVYSVYSINSKHHISNVVHEPSTNIATLISTQQNLKSAVKAIVENMFPKYIVEIYIERDRQENTYYQVFVNDNKIQVESFAIYLKKVSGYGVIRD